MRQYCPKSNLRYIFNVLYYDILIRAITPYELQQMVQELAGESVNHGLKMAKSKTKVMMEKNTLIWVSNTQIESVESYIYLGHRYSTREQNKDNDIQIRITVGWSAFASTATWSSVTLEYARRDKWTMRTSSNDIWRGNKYSHQRSKEQASSCTNKDRKENLSIW